MLDRILSPFAKRFAWIATALRVQNRFGEIQGGHLGSAVTLTLFLSVFPLLLIAIALIGYIVENDTDLTSDIISNLGLTGQPAQTLTDALNHAASTQKAASIFGLLGLAWASLGVPSAIKYAIDTTWQQTGGGIKNKAISLGWSLGALVILGISIAITATTKAYLDGTLLFIATMLISLLINFGFWMWTFTLLAQTRVNWRGYIPGAIFAAIGLELIKQVAALLPELFGGSSTLYGSIGVVFGLIAIIALFGKLMVYASVLNVVRWEEDHGTVTTEMESPRIKGKVPTDATRSGAVKS